MHVTTVKLGERSYPIYLGSNIIDRLATIYHSLNLPQRAAIVCDTNVARLHLKNLVSVLQQHNIETTNIIIPTGERQKSLKRASVLYDELVKHRFARNDAMIAFGGGVVGDLTGFVAATFRRGVPFIQVPTTLLAQVESSIGGKTAVNHPTSKNAIGVFYQPKLVFSDVNFLSTLPRREIICGLGEVLKYGYLDKGVFTFLERHLEDVLSNDLNVVQEIIFRCNEMKAKLIAEDERETNPTGGRMVINLGHTIGQALEVLSNYRLHHGEAILIGLKWELLIAQEVGIVNRSDFQKISQLLSRVGFNPSLRGISSSVLIKHLYDRNRTVRFVLPRSIGDVITTSSIDMKLVTSIIKKMLKR